MFGVSFTELAVVALVILIVVGPQKLPSMLYTLGRWMRKLRQLTTEVRAQTGIDEILRQEGFEGGLGELRSMLRGDIEIGKGARRREYDYDDPYEETYELDQSREYPPEGADAAGAVPDDLVDAEDDDEAVGAADDAPAAAGNDTPAADDDTPAADDAPATAANDAPAADDAPAAAADDAAPVAADEDPVIEVSEAVEPDAAASDPPWKKAPSADGAELGSDESEPKVEGDEPKPEPHA